jgi:hypothetical protein
MHANRLRLLPDIQGDLMAEQSSQSIEADEAGSDTVSAARPLTILDIIRIVLPSGTQGNGRWESVCVWPPDLFAVVASITERSGLYSEDVFTSFWASGFTLTEQWIRNVRDVGQEWADTDSPPRRVRELWHALVRNHGSAPIEDSSPAAIVWKKIVFDLLVIADEACAGVGFLPGSDDDLEGTKQSAKPAVDENASEKSEQEKAKEKEEPGGIQYAVYRDYKVWAEHSKDNPDHIGGDLLPHLPSSLCILVPPQLLCVQPKATTPAVGCTLRSLTHNLALVPAIGNVRTSWIPASEMRQHNDPFNILVVPFPYFIPGGSFCPVKGRFPGEGRDRVFTLDVDKWMNREPVGWAGPVSAQDFADFLCGLIAAAKAELEPVHAIVMPETAIRIELANDVAKILAAKTDLDLFLTGVLSKKDGTGRNQAAIYHFRDKDILQRSFQSKHHRWGLEGGQIKRYQLGHVLAPDFKWWEQIDVSDRACYVTSFRSYATLSVLVCEDLARYDPVLTVMNAIGPNLVVALLMDGPQLEQRWSGRYAMALADDPGSAVLTVTSFGMVARSRNPGDEANREVALWKEQNGKAQVLKLPKGSHGLLLTLTNRLVKQFTLDGRDDGGMTMQFSLGAAHGIAHTNPPAWVGPAP